MIKKDISKNIRLKLALIVGVMMLFLIYQSITIYNKGVRKIKEEMYNKYDNYYLSSYSQVSNIVLTNAITISNSERIKNALINNDKSIIEEYLSYTILSQNFSLPLDGLKIHIHDKDKHSFYRSWRSDSGDDLSTFRKSLDKVHELEQPIVVTEIGREGLLIRGISPIIHDFKLLGTIEFAYRYSRLCDIMKQLYKVDSVLVIDELSENIGPFHENKLSNKTYFSSKPYPIYLDKVILSNEGVSKFYRFDDSKSFGIVKDIKSGNEVVAHFYISQPKSDINELIYKDLDELALKLAFILFMGFSAYILLYYILKSNVFDPLYKLKNRVSKEIKLDHELENDVIDDIDYIEKSIETSEKKILTLLGESNINKKYQEQYLKAIEESSILFKFNTSGELVYLNDMAKIKIKSLITCDQKILFSQIFCSYSEESEIKIWESLLSGKVVKGVFVINSRYTDTPLYLQSTSIPISLNGEIIEFILVLSQDVSEIVNIKNEIQRNLTTDRLTLLPNRESLIQDVDRKIISILVIVDIISFNDINELYGLSFGDEVLIHVAKTLHNLFYPTNVKVYRIQGDKFACAILKPSKLTVSYIENFVVKINNRRLSYSVGLDEKIEVNLSFRFGVSDQYDLFKTAELAHKLSKSVIGNVVVYDSSIYDNEKTKNNLNMLSTVANALNEGHVYPVFQPIINVNDPDEKKYESLVRIKDFLGNEVSPFYFLELSKRFKLYESITKVMIEKTIDKMKNVDGEFSINICSSDIESQTTTNFIVAILRENLEIAKRIIFEIVETESIDNIDLTKSFLDEIQSLGCKVAIDDFGTGYSNFSNILKLSPNYIKIDGSLIKNITTDNSLQSIVSAIVSFSSSNNITCIAEFVCDEHVYETIKKLGIKYSQGFYTGKPTSDLR